MKEEMTGFRYWHRHNWFWVLLLLPSIIIIPGLFLLVLPGVLTKVELCGIAMGLTFLWLAFSALYTYFYNRDYF